MRTSAIQTIRRAALITAPAFCALLLAASPANAQAHPGIRGGMSVAPGTRVPDVTTQLYIGAHVETRPLVGRLAVRPNVETGFGDGLVVIDVNGEFLWKFPPRGSGWAFYAGGGPEIAVFRFGIRRFGQRDAAVTAGVRFLAGFEHRSGVFIEVKLSTLDRPDIIRPLLTGLKEVKVGAGYTCR